MSLLLRIVTIVVVLLAIVVIFGFVMPSLIALLIAVLVVMAISDFFYRRKRHAAHIFNSALQAVCERDGGINKVAMVFARTGSLRGPCYEYARRLHAGEDPVDAAAQSRVPLDLSSAVVLRTGRKSRESQDYVGNSKQVLSSQSSTMPIYAHVVYLVLTSLATCAVLAFCSIFISPTIEKITEEFGMASPVFGMTQGMGLIKIILAVVSITLVVLMTVISSGSLFGMLLPDWFPRSPRAVELRSNILWGLADAIDAGMTVDQALHLGTRISLRNSDRSSFAMAYQLIRQGSSPADALHQAGWLNENERNWIRGASAHRGAQLLRSIANQRLRDASANMRWILDLVFPVLVILLGFAVLLFAFGFFGSLISLISGLG